MKIKKSQLKRLIEDFLYEESEEESEEEEEEVDSPVKDLETKIEDTEDDFQAYNIYKSWGEENPNEKHKIPEKVVSYLKNTLGYNLDSEDKKDGKTYSDFLIKHARDITIKTNAKKIDMAQGKT